MSTSSHNRYLEKDHKEDLQNRIRLRDGLKALRGATGLTLRAASGAYGIRPDEMERNTSWRMLSLHRWAALYNWEVRWRIEGFDVPDFEFDWSLPPEELTGELRAQVRVIRKHLGISTRELDQRLGQSLGSCSRWEVERKPDMMIAVAQRIVRALGGRLVFLLVPGPDAPVVPRSLRRQMS